MPYLNMSDTQQEIYRIFEETGALLKGHFILRSGLRSAHYFQCARVCEHLAQVTRLAELLINKLETEDYDSVIAPAMGGLVIGQEVARQLNKRFIFAEKIDGDLAIKRFKVNPGEKFLIVEDVITRGGRVQETIDVVKAAGGVPVSVSVLVDRSQGNAKFEIPFQSLLELSFPTYEPDNLPPELAAVPPSKMGS